jgi:hypothetical protein
MKEQERFESLHPDLQKCVAKLKEEHAKLGKDWEILVVSGHRTQAEQDDCVRRKVSRCVWPSSPHNSHPSLGVDLQATRGGKLIGSPEAEKLCAEIAEALVKIASDLGISIRWGGTFKKKDLPHYELAKEWDAIKRDPKALMRGAT